MFNRLLTIRKNNSFFLFGARGTGKSTWLSQEFASIPHLYIDLLNPDEEEKFSKNPGSLLAQIEGMDKKNPWVIIDEIQKVPKLLDVAHLCIEKHKTLFALTGSSARKLKRGNANLLAGRAFMFHLFPLTHCELLRSAYKSDTPVRMKRAREYHPDMQDSVNEQFSLEQVLQWGSLPLLYHTADAPDKIRYLRTYTQTYLKEEIVAEQIIRKLNPFRLFLEIAAQHNGEIANYSNIARDVGVDTVTIQSYFQILEDTLVGFLLPAFHQSIRKRQRTNPKFYYFDLGIKRSLDGTVVQPLVPNTYGYGKAFEHFVILEAVRLNAYLERDFRFSYLLTKDRAEIDLIIERPGMPVVLVEIKSSGNVDERDTRTVERFLKDFKKGEGYCWSLDPIAKKIGSVRALHWREGLKEVGLAPLSP